LESRTLGNYQVLEPLGSGGMGEVYKARDTRLNRLVAIKVLRGDLSASATGRQRFIQEAKAASALNHPNIVTIYDIFEYDGMDCLVMEYIAGKTLHALIPRQGMPWNEALPIAVQVAEGLRKAHSAGIVHRDIKPSNVLVPGSGPVKILDFGLAKLAESEALAADDNTRTAGPVTQAGAVVGTVSYMSPEQAQGKPVDSRSDIFSFGSVLYEMLTGRRVPARFGRRHDGRHPAQRPRAACLPRLAARAVAHPVQVPSEKSGRPLAGHGRRETVAGGCG